MPPIAICVLQNDDAILLARLFVRIIICLRHPQPPAVIDAKRNRLLDVRFASKKRDIEPPGHLHRLRRLQWRERFLDNRLRVLLGTPQIERNQ